MPIARSILIRGHVQGVFFREWLVRVASGIGVTGWVRNRSDGSVEIYAAGETEQIDRLIAELHVGSPASRVDEVRTEPAALEQLAGFARRASV